MKNHMLSRLIGLFVSVTFVATASAVTITYGVNGISTFTLAPSTDTLSLGAWGPTSLSLTPGVPVNANINTLTFNVGDSGTLVGNFSYPLTRLMSVTLGGTQTVGQIGDLSVTLAADQLTLLPGGTLSFNLPGYILDVTPLGLTTAAFGVGGSGTYNVKGTFLLTSVPDAGATCLLLGAAFTGVAVLRRRLS
jgi:hypothetical protein